MERSRVEAARKVTVSVCFDVCMCFVYVCVCVAVVMRKIFK